MVRGPFDRGAGRFKVDGNGESTMKNSILALALAFTPLLSASCGRAGGRSSAPLNFTDQATLRDASKVRTALTEQYGLQPIRFRSEDGEDLQALLLERPNAVASLVVCPGLLCKKEMYAALINLLPENYNILFFDARGQGQSRGWNLWIHARSYGKKEWKDIKGAIAHVVAPRYPNKPIFVMGFCSGAYHAARALIELRNDDLIEQLNIKGLIFDSGWYSVYEAAKTAPYDMCRNLLQDKFTQWCPRAGSMTAQLIYMILYPFIATAKKVILDTAYWRNDRRLNIFNHLRTLDLPILFIQSKDDTQIPFEHVYNLAQTIPNEFATEWWIEPGLSKHAWHFLYVPIEYRYHTHNFFKDALGRVS